MTQEMVPLVMDSRYIPKRRIDSTSLSSQCGRGYYPKQFQGFKPRDMMNCNDVMTLLKKRQVKRKSMFGEE